MFLCRFYKNIFSQTAERSEPATLCNRPAIAEHQVVSELLIKTIGNDAQLSVECRLQSLSGSSPFYDAIHAPIQIRNA